MCKTFSWCVLLLICVSLCFASGDDDAPIESLDTVDGGGESVYGKLEYRHDVLSPRRLFMLLMAYPGKPVPMITGVMRKRMSG